jgi:glucose-6-phosphate isomerase
MPHMAIEKTPEWQALLAHHRNLRETRMSDLFAADPSRAQKFTARCSDIRLDYSKNRITDETMTLLRQLAQAADVKGWTAKLFGGERINTSEDRPALHTALRQRDGRISVGGSDIIAEVKAVRARMAKFATEVRDGAWTVHTGTRITDIVHIGIGGSDLGPRMVVEALRPNTAPLRVHFASSLDDAELAAALERLVPASTLFIVASKSFTTPETLANARLAKQWLLASLKEEALVRGHFVALTSKPDEAKKFGVEAANIYPMWDWVGGRYSLWSSIGLPIALALGSEEFEALLAGAAAMDAHFLEAPFEQNLPVTLALLSVWYANFFGAETQAILPYDWRLRLLPTWLQQVEMESNGKSVDRDGKPVSHATAPIIWGSSGNDGQHAYFQALHQGTHLVPADFLIALSGGANRGALLANCFAQSEALMMGRDARQAGGPHKAMPGNRPSNTITFPQLDAPTLGALLAMYEHKTFVEGVIWGINSFDQWGVELGKVLAARIEPELNPRAKPGVHDASTSGLIAAYRDKG